MIRQLAMVLLVSVLGAWIPRGIGAEKYPLLSGSVLEGDPISWDTRGVIFKLSSGEYSSREGFTNFSQTALKLLAANPKIASLVEPFIIEEDIKPSPPPPEPKLRPVPRLERPNPKTNSIFASPLSVTIFFMLYLANIYAGLEVARYRRQPPSLVCGLAAVAPVVGPIIYLSLPSRMIIAPEEPTHAAGLDHHITAEAGAADAEQGAAGPAEPAAPGAPPAPAAPPPPIIFRRPHTTFNRRFFETKLAGFLRVVPSDAEKDMVVCVSSARGNYIGQRIMRIMPNELMLLVKKGEASSDVLIPFNEISEVQVRHKDLDATS